MAQPTQELVSHPSERILDEYCQGAEEQIPVIEAHLEECGECRHKVVRLVREHMRAEGRTEVLR